MSYYDDYEDEYIEYNDRMVEPVGLVSEMFSEAEITEVLTMSGLVSEKSPKYSGNMEKLVFIYGDENEAYSSLEIRFTEQIGQVFMYSDFDKSLRKGNMVCRVIATKINEEGHDAITACVAFEKIIDKAFKGFNIFLFLTKDCVYFGCRIFDKNEKCDCALSNPIYGEHQFEKIIDEFLYTSAIDEFMDFYGQIQSIITTDQDPTPNYEDIVMRRTGICQSYLDDLDEVGRTLGVDFSGEKERYWNALNGEVEESFVTILDEVCESLSFIKSNRVNTYEMLFEADEMVRQAETTEAQNERIVLAGAQEYDDEVEVSDDDARSLLQDPEEVIKLLKKRKGL